MSQEQDGKRPARRKRPGCQLEFDPVTQRCSRRIRYEVEEIPIVEASVDEIKGDEDSPHIILKFILNTEERKMYDRIWNVPLLRHRTFNWKLLGTLGQAERVRTLLGPRWATILEFDQKQYVELVHEFYATFRHKNCDFNVEHAVSFSLGRQLFEMSVPRFAVLTGLYTEEEVQTSAFTESVRGYTIGTRRYWIQPLIWLLFGLLLLRARMLVMRLHLPFGIPFTGIFIELLLPRSLVVNRVTISVAIWI